MIEMGSCMAIKAPSQSFEIFYIMKVKAKGVAEKNISDSTQEHFVLQGETYLIGQWVSFQQEHKNYVQYKMAANAEGALINVAEVFHTGINCNWIFMNIVYSVVLCNIYFELF